MNKFFGIQRIKIPLLFVSLARPTTFLMMASMFVYASTLDASSRSSRKAVVSFIKNVNADYDSSHVSMFINDLKDEEDPGVLIGDDLKYTISSDTSKFLYLVLINPKGNVSVVFPGRSLQDTQKKYTTFQYPPAGAGPLKQADPVGIETVIVFASDVALKPQDFGFSPDFDVHKIGNDGQTIQDFVAQVNGRFSISNTIGFSYQYFVDSDVQFNTRAVRRELKERVRQVELIANSENRKVNSVEGTNVALKDKSQLAGSLSEAIAVNDIRFETNSDSLSSLGRVQLDIFGSELLNVFANNPNILVTLDGHTDDRGELDYNQRLSERRAQAAKQYFISEFGLPERGIRARGFGETAPISSNATAQERAMNRRVEIRLGQN